MAAKESGSVSRPPLLTGGNYSYWKARMTVFISQLDDDAWYYVENAWNPPMITATEGTSTSSTSKLESSWTSEEKTAKKLNAKALNAIFH